ncbi:flagellar biosynthetic protein FliQ [Ferrimicrobium acidiphilum]|jgi:flagellar biosynthetic protein FliQ|uniref:Flagellar biosynthetic protein FliQ n=1 Tax=Ferrimicrobium acidiphilum DSM 19497 TaxID=1121877 RepID=A0A0D8FUG0_9ACTN|nr:flagellar biosynthetic protein FliQ [Ferrimicrobium acidiphilum]KJE76599.1 flagellar biosynthetic protein FliQ [Ferrimicrobium acidiphilum DSM 19497]MCL5053935.1 flagellar biosynthetic protein FliQ [Gammaproteobacteria bacterium]
MNDGPVLQIAGQTLYLAAKLAGPVLAGALAIGLVVAFIQTLTQIQEATLSFLPKLVVIALIIFLAGHWMLSELDGFTIQLYREIPSLVSSL